MMSRVWAMPNKWTFQIIPIAALLRSFDMRDWVDPFAGRYSPAGITNDIEQDTARYHLDGLEFLKSQPSDSAGGALFDPPYSVEQCLRRYTPKYKGTAGRAEYWAKCKDEIARIVRPNGFVICFAWDSTGIGKSRGFTLQEVILVCHGACHNDTIITIERKLP